MSRAQLINLIDLSQTNGLARDVLFTVSIGSSNFTESLGQYVESLTVDMGYDTVSSRASVVFTKSPVDINANLGTLLSGTSRLFIRAGYKAIDGSGDPLAGDVQIFQGYIVDEEQEYFPYNTVVNASGILSKCQVPYHADLTYDSSTDNTIVNDLFQKATEGWLGTLAGASQTLGTKKTVKLTAGRPTWDLINEIDQVVGYITYDGPTGPVRKRWAPVPVNTAAWLYNQGTNIFGISRPRTRRNVRNKVTVYGLSQGTTTITSTAQVTSPYVYNPPQYIAYEFRSSLIETSAYADTVALRKLKELNRIVEEITMSVPGNPLLAPGMTVSVAAAQIGLDSATLFWVKHVQHRIDSSGFVTTLTLEGGAGQEGYLVPGDTNDVVGGTGGDPVAQISITTSAEANISNDVFTLLADGGSSYDPDGTTLTYAWSNDATADTGTAETYSVNFTQAQWDAGPTITLVVTDADGNTDTDTYTVVEGVTPVTQQELYVAAWDQLEASGDGGRTWQTYSLPSWYSYAAAEIQPAGVGWFGTHNGILYKTTDYLATAPTNVKDFGGIAANVQCIWVNEKDANRITVGVTNSSGGVYRSTDGSTFGTVTTANKPIYLIESANNYGEYRFCEGTGAKRTFNDFASVTTVHAYGNTCYKWALSNFSNYHCGHDSAGGNARVFREDDTEITFPATPDTINYGLAHHIRDDILFAAVNDGTDLIFYRKAAGATAFTALATLAAATYGSVWWLQRDGGNADVLYMGTDEMLLKTVDGGSNWFQLRSYPSTLSGRAVGYGSPSWIPSTATGGTVQSAAGTGTILSLWNGSGNDAPPASWFDIDFDDAAWIAPVTATGGTPVSGTANIWASALPSDDTERVLFRHSFTLSAGAVKTATLTIKVDNDALNVLINGITVHQDTSGTTAETAVTVDPTVLIPNGSNILAIYAANVDASNAAISYKLVLT